MTRLIVVVSRRRERGGQQKVVVAVVSSLSRRRRRTRAKEDKLLYSPRLLEALHEFFEVLEALEIGQAWLVMGGKRVEEGEIRECEK